MAGRIAKPNMSKASRSCQSADFQRPIADGKRDVLFRNLHAHARRRWFFVKE
jgi:hypothetical protein